MKCDEFFNGVREMNIRYFGKKLRSCKAEVLEGTYPIHKSNCTVSVACYVLKSYNTYVAILTQHERKLFVFDFYSNTTAQHVAKFAHDYGAKEVYYLYQRSDHTGYYNYVTGERKTFTQTINDINI